MSKIKTYERTEIEAAKQRMCEASASPPAKLQHLSRRQAVAEMRSEIRDLRRRKYSWAQIDQIVSSGVGDAFGANVLKAYFKRPKARQTKESAQKAAAAASLSPKRRSSKQRVSSQDKNEVQSAPDPGFQALDMAERVK